MPTEPKILWCVAFTGSLGRVHCLQKLAVYRRGEEDRPDEESDTDDAGIDELSIRGERAEAEQERSDHEKDGGAPSQVPWIPRQLSPPPDV